MFNRKRKNQPRNPSDQSTKRVYSYYSNTRLRADEKPRARIRDITNRISKPKTWWRHTPSIMALLVIFVCLGYILSVNTDPKIVQSNSQGVFLQSNATYESAAQEIINKSALNHNKITLNVADISKQLQARFPELSNVSMTIPLVNRRPVIYISGSQPAFILQTSSGTTLIDSRGVAILPAYQVKNISKYNLPTVIDQSNLQITLGKQFLTKDDINFITDINKQFFVQSQTVDRLTLPAVANQLDVRIKAQKYFIKMDITGDSREQVGAYLAAKRKLEQLHKLPSEYIDVRIPGRVFYK